MRTNYTTNRSDSSGLVKHAVPTSAGTDREVEFWHTKDGSGVVVATESMSGAVIVPRSEMVQLAAALGIGDTEEESLELAAMKERLVKLMGALRSCALREKLSGHRRTEAANLWARGQIARVLGGFDPQLPSEPPTLPTEPGAGVVMRNRNSPGFEEFRLTSEGNWVSRVANYATPEGLLAHWKLVRVLP